MPHERDAHNPRDGRRPLVAGVTLAALRAIEHAALPFNPFRRDTTLAHARALEALGVDFLVIEDSALDTAGVADGHAALALEAFTLASYLAVTTRHIGLVPVVNTNYAQPFAAARLIASLDHVSHGRAGWLAVTDESGNAAANHGAAPSADTQRRARQREFIDVVEQLFDSWESGAFVRDKASGAFVDLTRAHFIEHAGAAFQVKGPLNIAASPQGRPPRLRPDGRLGTDVSTLTLQRVTPCVADTRAEAESLAVGLDGASEGTFEGTFNEAFVGTWADWEAHIATLHARAGRGMADPAARTHARSRLPDAAARAVRTRGAPGRAGHAGPTPRPATRHQPARRPTRDGAPDTGCPCLTPAIANFISA